MQSGGTVQQNCESRMDAIMESSRLSPNSFWILSLKGMLSFVLLFQPVCHANAQDPLKLIQLNHTSWTAREEAPSEIAGLGQTPDGVLWIGGGGGLFRFDGNKFSLFQPPAGEPPLPRISVTALYVSHDGTVWVGFRPTGLAAIKNGHVTIYGSKEGLPSGTVSQLAEGPDGTVWAIAQEHLFSLRGGRWVDELNPSFCSERVYKMFFDKAGTQWVGTNKWIYRRPRGQQSLERTKEQGGQVVQFAESPDGSLWMVGGYENSSQGFVKRLDVEGHPFSRPFQVSLQPDDLLADRDGMLWVAAQDGVWRINPSGGDPNAPAAIDRFGRADGLSSDNTTRLTEDASGDIWVGTMRGLERFKQPKLISAIGVPVSDSRVVVTSCNNGDVWVGASEDALVSMHNGQPLVRIKNNKQISSLYCDKENTIWFTDDVGIGRFDGKGTQYIQIPEGLPPASAKQVIRANDGSLFVPFRNAGGLWKWANGSWSHVVTPGFPSGTEFVIFYDRQGKVWAGFANGTIGMLEGGAGHTMQSAGLGDVTVFAETSYGFLAGGMNGIALFRGGGFIYLPFRDTNRVRGISGLVESADGDLWLNGSYGIVMVPKAEITKALAERNYRMNAEVITEGSVVGPAPLTYAMPSAVAGASGTIWFTNSSKAIYVDPKRFPRNPVPPLLTILSVSADGGILSDYRRIAAGTNTLVIRYSGINLTAPERVIYRYKLDGSDDSWQDVGARTEAVYTRLRPGKYRFHVLASNGEGGWSESSTQQFTVLPHFYQALWFLILAAATIIAAIWLVLIARIHRISERVRIRAEERADERVRIARDLHDTLLQGVQGLMLRFHVASQEIPEGTKARIKLEQALTTADGVLLEGRDRVRSLRSNSLNGLTLVQALEAVGTHFVDHYRIKFAVLTEGLNSQVDAGVLEEVFCIGREAISNAFQHAQASSITVTVTYNQLALCVSCLDDGRGIPEDVLKAYQREGHWGLVGMKERATRIGGTFSCQIPPAGGTLVKISVPAHLAYSDSGVIRQMFWTCRRMLRL